MFNRDVVKLKKIYDAHKDFFEIINRDPELYMAFRTDEGKDKNYISIYCGGNVFANIGLRTILADGTKRIRGAEEFFSGLEKSEDKFGYYIEKTQILKQAIKNTKSYQNDSERTNQMMIAKRHSVKKATAVLDVEAVIPEDGGIENKNPEIDMLIFDSRKNILYLTEYKCTEKALTGLAGVEVHYSDMKKILDNKELKKRIIESEVGIYEMLTGKAQDCNKIDVKMAFCFTGLDRAIVKNHLKKLKHPECIYVWFSEIAKNLNLEIDPITVEDFLNF